MVPYYGDYAEDDTVLIPFNTFSSNDPTASVTVTNLADADIKIHKDGSVTEIATDGATITINFDTITGNHLITIDTSVHADYSTGSEYSVRVEGATVDAGTINAWVGAFSIERAGGVLALLKAGTVQVDVETIKTQAITCSAGVTINPSVGAATIVPTNTQFEARSLPSADYTIVADLGTVQTADHTAAIADIPTVAEFNARSLLSADYTVVSDLGTVQTADHTAAIADIPTNAELASAFTEIKGATWAAGTDTLEHIRNKQTDIETDTAEIGVAGAGLTNLGASGNNWNTVVPDAAGVAPTAAEIKTAMEAAGSDLDYIMKDKINRKRITILTGDTEQFNDAGASIGTIAAAYTDDGTTVERLRMVQ